MVFTGILFYVKKLYLIVIAGYKREVINGIHQCTGSMQAVLRELSAMRASVRSLRRLVENKHGGAPVDAEEEPAEESGLGAFIPAGNVGELRDLNRKLLQEDSFMTESVSI